MTFRIDILDWICITGGLSTPVSQSLVDTLDLQSFQLPSINNMRITRSYHSVAASHRFIFAFGGQSGKKEYLNTCKVFEHLLNK